MSKLLCALLLLPSLALAAEQPVVAETTLAVDWLQTRQIALQPAKYSETNILLGAHPGVTAVNVYFGAVILADYIITANVAPATAVKINTTLTVLEVLVILKNISLGLALF